MEDAFLRFKNNIGIYPSNLGDFVKLCRKKNIKKTNINITKEEIDIPIGDTSFGESYFTPSGGTINEIFQRVNIIAYFNTSFRYVRGCEILETMDKDKATNITEKIKQYKTDLTKRLKEYGMACSFKA